MTVAAVVSMLAAVVALSCCLILIFHKDYEDGMLGRIGLVMIAFAAFARVTNVLFSLNHHGPGALAVLGWVGIALFLGRLTYRFVQKTRRTDFVPAQNKHGSFSLKR